MDDGRAKPLSDEELRRLRDKLNMSEEQKAQDAGYQKGLCWCQLPVHKDHIQQIAEGKLTEEVGTYDTLSEFLVKEYSASMTENQFVDGWNDILFTPEQKEHWRQGFIRAVSDVWEQMKG